MLDAEHCDERKVDNHRATRRHGRSRPIDGLGNDREVADEGYQIEEGREEYRIANRRKGQAQRA